jgi:hypothetical protein
VRCGVSWGLPAAELPRCVSSAAYADATADHATRQCWPAKVRNVTASWVTCTILGTCCCQQLAVAGPVAAVHAHLGTISAGTGTKLDRVL